MKALPETVEQPNKHGGLSDGGISAACSYRGLFTAGWFGVREKHCSQLKIYDHLRESEHAANN